MAQENQYYSNKIEEKSHKFIRHLYYSIRDYHGQLPILRDIFRPEAIDWLLTESLNDDDDGEGGDESNPIIDFVINTGYKDEPKVGDDGKPLLYRTTPIHRAYRDEYDDVSHLFQIYDRFDVNYTDEDGLTHFHVACKYGCVDVVKKFFDHGQDPNCLVTKTGDSPLLLAMKRNSQEVVELLLRNGANPNLANEEGTTPLHLLSDDDMYLIMMLFELSNAKYQPLQINAQNNLGNTPLHMAMRDTHEWFMDFLLKHGADPNATNEEGSTPLHLFCKQGRESAKVLELFFEIAKDVDRVVEIDARDKKGRTPLQWAVANFLPDVVELLLDQGADLSNFVFPTEIYIVDRSELPRVAPRAMEVVERLQRRGYELQRNDALTIMKFFAKYELLEKSNVKGWFDEAENTLELLAIGLPPSEAANILGYDEIQHMSSTLNDLVQSLDECSAKRVCEKATRRFFRRWALDPLLKLTNYELPILCCDKIMDQLMNKDLFNVCLAATDQSS